MIELLISNTFRNLSPPDALVTGLSANGSDTSIILKARAIEGTVSFDVPGTFTITSSETITDTTVVVPAAATLMYIKAVRKSTGATATHLEFATNTRVISVEFWEGLKPDIRVEFKGCSNLVKVPTTAPKWSNWSNLFYNCTSFNQDISMWQTGHVTSLFGSFLGCAVFNKPLNSWNTSNVTDMGNTFASCSAFNQPLNNWNTGNVTTMAGMFTSCSAFNQSLNSWNTVKVVLMASMFRFCSAFNQTVSNWNVANVTNMGFLFGGCTTFNQNLSNLTFPKVTLANRVNYDQNTPSWVVGNKPNFTIKT